MRIRRLALAIVVERNVRINKAADISPGRTDGCGKIVVSAAIGGHGGVAHQDDQIRLVIVAIGPHGGIGALSRRRHLQHLEDIIRSIVRADGQIQSAGATVVSFWV